MTAPLWWCLRLVFVLLLSMSTYLLILVNSATVYLFIRVGILLQTSMAQRCWMLGKVICDVLAFQMIELTYSKQQPRTASPYKNLPYHMLPVRSHGAG